MAESETRYRVGGMDCAACATKIDTAVRRVAGVADVSVSVMAGTMTVRHDGSSDLKVIEKRVMGLGYSVAPLAGSAAPAREHGSHHYDDHDHGDHAGHDHGHEGHDHAGHDHDHANHDHANHDHASHDHDHGEKEIEGLHGHDHAPMAGPWWQRKKGRLTILSGVALVVAYAVGHLVPAIAPYAFIVAMLVGLVPIARRAVMAALSGTPFSIEMLMTIAAVGAVIINAGEEAATVVFLFLVGELLEGVAAGKARESIQSLTGLVPKSALLEDNGQTREVPAESLAVGAIIMVRPGDRISADGIIISGESAIDEAPVTGESTPVRKGVDAVVFAGTVNGDAVLRVRVTAAAADNTIARVVKLVEEAQESKAPTERFIDRFSRYYTPGVVVVAALVAVVPPLLFAGPWGEWVYKGLAILLIGCPCALVISTPAAIAASLSSGARRGLLMKGGAVLETLGKVTMVAFDKTGTLTEGKPQVTDIISFGLSEAQVLSRAAVLERGSSHPLALAILNRAKADGVPVPPAFELEALPGKGVSGKVGGETLDLLSPPAARERGTLSAEQDARITALNDEGKSVSVLLVNGIAAGLIAMRDEPREDAEAGLAALKSAGVKAMMLTGDNKRTAAAVAGMLGIDWRGEMMPEDKQRVVGELKRQGFIVAKVGDGINDAPALAAADIGIAMGGGTDVALETADAAVLHGRVGDVARMIELSKRTMRNILQNITIALGLKAVFLVTTIAGITGLWPAILADTGATVLVTINALRLLRIKI
ncbi:heavy metal translocating P-type ATPase [Rhizobium ruizarguesonis]|uniref:heavy metal translocating P-type ATPase n=1 Tax=Rhizobium ruizarguesonis TaxID=2081791 RepID=UPI0010318C72|nr:heavy metal translocating P-type ATPase [Rhizobium ruizarguesonis]MBY5855762.1 heavy metal translocating P-type ATPase [Rhizobium leguminosarum]MBY5891218.1 heavy metal translocating P-type ATPase [Rhizobium leguminosarum]QSZ03444.1 heavy metal translocating P-type ATPase [Rhizobium ruizarguesonis]TAY82255.1 heavy metal translocating P-type ATPase [Rhizobium ruizarguesonis]TAZ37760.1 heavy metal translocating P-type ATPase [Rhizobium ruizarguesonis]